MKHTSLLFKVLSYNHITDKTFTYFALLTSSIFRLVTQEISTLPFVSVFASPSTQPAARTHAA